MLCLNAASNAISETLGKHISGFWPKTGGSAIAFFQGMSETWSSSRARNLALQQRSFELTCAIINYYPAREHMDDPSRIIWRNLIRATSSSTFNLEEADGASSDADFVSKMRIALREAKETHVSLRIIHACKLAGHQNLDKCRDEANQLAAIFRTIIKNKQLNMRQKKRAPSAEH